MPAPTDSVEIPAIPTSVVTAAGTDIHPVSQGGVTKQETNAQILSYIQGAIAIPLAQISDASANGRSLVAAANYAAMLTLLSAAPLASPTFTGVPAAPTAAPGTNTTQLATTAFVLANAGVGSVTNVTASAPLASSGGATPDISFTGILASTLGGTGVNNAGTITNASNTTITGGGTLALGGFIATIPATLTVAGLAIANVFTAAQSVTVDDAVTNATTTLLTLDHSSSGTPAANFGARLLFNLESDTTLSRNATAIDGIWTTATDATRASAIVFSTVASGGALTERVRIASNAITFTAVPILFTNSASNGVVWNNASILQSGTRLAISTASTERISILTGGDIGVGQSAPLAKMHILAGTTTANAPKEVLRIDANVTTGATGASAGFGPQLTFFGESSVDTTQRQMADMSVTWVVATDASRTARIVGNVWDTAAREWIRGESSGSAAMIGVLGAAAVVRQTGGENLTNNVASGGTDGTIANYTDLTIYANDAAAIRNDIYQLARMLKQDHDALRLYGFLT